MSTVTEELKEVKKRLEKQTAHFKELLKERMAISYIYLNNIYTILAFMALQTLLLAQCLCC